MKTIWRNLPTLEKTEFFFKSWFGTICPFHEFLLSLLKKEGNIIFCKVKKIIKKACFYFESYLRRRKNILETWDTLWILKYSTVQSHHALKCYAGTKVKPKQISTKIQKLGQEIEGKTLTYSTKVYWSHLETNKSKYNYYFHQAMKLSWKLP